MTITHIGTATVLLEIGGLRLLTDPALDPPGGRYRFRVGFSSTRLTGPALPPGGLPPLDAVLLSHDHHADNLDPAGRALLPGAGRVLTTPSGARRLGGNAEPLACWEETVLRGPDGLEVTVTATPARHGPPGVGLIEWETTGFLLRWPGQAAGPLWISGDTVDFAGIDELGRRGGCGTALLHLGAVGFPLTGPLRYTLHAAGAVRAVQVTGAQRVVPVHYQGWTHFREGRPQVEAAFAAAGLGERLRWLTPGQPTPLLV